MKLLESSRVPAENPSGSTDVDLPPGGPDSTAPDVPAGPPPHGASRSPRRSALLVQARRWTWIFLTAAAVFAAAGCLSGALGDRWWAFEALGAFRVQYAWVLVVTAAAFAVGRR